MFIKGKDVNKMVVTYQKLEGEGLQVLPIPNTILSRIFLTQPLQWHADYTVDYLIFGRPVVNHIHAELTLSPTSGLIIKQEDSFDFWAWAKQGLGIVGALFGWSSVIHNKVRASAAARLNNFIEKEAKKDAPVSSSL